MFSIDKNANRIIKLDAVRFSDLGFGERKHLQEWLANQPDALGEELLVIQKEFAGFDETKERLDLLALDKFGALVVIENKLDDSGRDVVWQCLKYASYCSTLSKTNVAQIYQQYLGKSAKAEDRICEFLGQEDFAEVELNKREQRLIMVAANFRKEVTSTAIWLVRHGIRVQCFKATPFQHETSILLNLEQVIPPPDAEELMIRISEKEKEEDSTEQGLATRHILRLEFWQRALEGLEAAGIDLFKNVGPSKDHWLNAGSGMSGVHYTMIFGKDDARVEFALNGSKTQNKMLFDHLRSHSKAIEDRFGAHLDWRPMDDKKASLIVYGKSFDGYNKESWPEMVKWLVEHVKRIEKAFAPEIDSMRQLVRNAALAEA